MTKASNAEQVPSPTQAACQLIVDKHHMPDGLSLWLWVAAGFLFLALTWVSLFIAASRADTRTVPLATKGGRP